METEEVVEEEEIIFSRKESYDSEEDPSQMKLEIRKIKEEMKGNNSAINELKKSVETNTFNLQKRQLGLEKNSMLFVAKLKA